MTDVREDLARYGSAIGRLYPALRGAMFARASLIDLMEGYRADKRFDEADAIRGILREWAMPLDPEVSRGIFTDGQKAINESLRKQGNATSRRTHRSVARVEAGA